MNVHIPNQTIVAQSKDYTHIRAHELIKYMSKFVTVSDEEAEILIASLDERSYTKGTLLLKEGQVSDLCYFVIKGCVRQYYMVDGEEKTTNFFTEGQPISVFEGIYKKQASKYYLSCLEDCVLSVGPTSEPEDLDLDPKYKSVCLTATESELNKSQEMLSMYMISSPEDRYLNLLKTRPELIARVPQYQLASYLGITPESLSRIRKRIMLKDF